MKSLLAMRIGWRFYLARQSNRFINFISFASTAGIALGVAVLIIVLSAMNGFEKELEERLLGVVSHGELVGVNEPIHDWQAVVADADKVPGIVAAAPFVRMQGLVQKPGGFQGVTVQGIDIEQEAKVSNIRHFMSEQSWQSLQEAKHNNIVLGKGLANNLGIEIGQSISLYMPNNNNSSQNKIAAAKSHRFVVSGIFELGGELDTTTAYVPMDYAAKLLKLEQGVSGVRIKVKNVFDAPMLIRDLGYSQKQYVYISDWTRTQGHLYQDIQLVRMVMYLVLALVIAVACFNIVSTLVMAVRDKQSEIAILLTMGMKKTSVMLIFIVQGALNGILGCIIGSIVGVTIALNLSDIAKGIESVLGIQLLSADVYFIDFLPSQLVVNDVITVVSLAFVMSLIATLYPAWKASQTPPASALAGR
ncbi:lipoprotein-releasing system transmembrane subunit LolE [Shewanella sp. Choline-02u-19]|jgi:lipoprotein-releasing system permease protein|uniref:lipoprotein-releasing ABC transporter permease subunit LolE n=1 Tax=unclassified Shewanella TaxID=196818 RepID=UPI000C346ED9|nr:MULTISPECIES: lipoprotein-releasing ABC transporter permease subunit LolE [unclassified Shewanella]PKG58084.1 lipoprotein-releasing system transmembrane subunit LolE [Shewanella sp. GutDb-MelDb]PKG73356.1 lipoprotein-releasing system transmembrane subunit LolE [Shewanella sp. GutCb]PKH59176.1 lipoprotein-releasing system transmembrane subunit LolE [Shewanella sp. Bg11-22]PKI27051.1 lipoprotein-releasing system transmembrane subunit LolE [Shewanella sp. Choline-02u-19]